MREATERLCVEIFISLFTGVRMGELLALTWEDVNFKKKSILITKDLIRVQLYDDDAPQKTKLIVQDTPKSNNSNRAVPLLEDLFRILVPHKQQQAIKNLPNPLGLVFPSKVGTHTDPRTYEKRIAAVSKRCEIQHVNVHALRHPYVKYTPKKQSVVAYCSNGLFIY